MFIFVKCASTIKKGDVISFDETLQLYTLAVNSSAVIGVAMNDAVQDSEDQSVYLVKMKLQGQAEAKASRDIPYQGGFLAVENGAVYTSTSEACGIIAPNNIGYPTRVAGDLVTITLR